jgi:hypothetical protein
MRCRDLTNQPLLRVVANAIRPAFLAGDGATVVYGVHETEGV